MSLGTLQPEAASTPLATHIATSTSNSTRSGLPACADPFAPFKEKAASDFQSEATLATVRLICASGIPPTIANLREWRYLFSILLSSRSKSSYRPPCASTLRDKHIPARAAKVTLDTRQLLRGEYNITLSFDGTTKGAQSLYTVHAITSDRLEFLYRGDVFKGSHNVEYVQTLLTEVCHLFLLIYAFI